jgi:hypothetical protein
MVRICSLCKNKLELNLKNFHKNKREVGGFDYRCKTCKLSYYNSNKEKQIKNSINWQLNNPIKYKEIQSKYKKSSKGKITRKKYTDKVYREKYGKDIQWTLKRNIRIRIYNSLKKEFKKGKTLDLLGCSIEDYKLYLESKFNKNMSWDNYGDYWEIDHIKPLSRYNLLEETEQFKAFHYTNTQPLTIIENRKKSNKYK